MDVQLRRLLDEREIVAIALKYAQAADQRDVDAFVSCFTPDAIYGPRESRCRGHAAIEARVRMALKKLDATHHVTTNFQVVVDGDTATMRSNYIATHLSGQQAPFVMGGYYEDRFERTEEGWLISQRDHVNVWTTGDHAMMDEGFGARHGLKT